MKKIFDTYASEFGWSMTLPPNWKRLSRRNPEDRTPVAVFSTPENWSLSLSWMISKRASEDNVLIDFDTATMLPGRINVDEASKVLGEIFTPLGEVIRANCVVLPDGKKALEIIEMICTDDSQKVKKLHYSLILPRRIRGEYRNKVHFQKLSFTAVPEAFHSYIKTIARTARTFHYPSMAA